MADEKVYSGTTAVFAIATRDENDYSVILGNIGDSRALLIDGSTAKCLVRLEEEVVLNI